MRPRPGAPAAAPVFAAVNPGGKTESVLRSGSPRLAAARTAPATRRGLVPADVEARGAAGLIAETAAGIPRATEPRLQAERWGTEVRTVAADASLVPNPFLSPNFLQRGARACGLPCVYLALSVMPRFPPPFDQIFTARGRCVPSLSRSRPQSASNPGKRPFQGSVRVVNVFQILEGSEVTS